MSGINSASWALSSGFWVRKIRYKYISPWRFIFGLDIYSVPVAFFKRKMTVIYFDVMNLEEKVCGTNVVILGLVWHGKSLHSSL